MPQPDEEGVWLSIDDAPEKTTWLFDTAFLLSPFTCIYGQGCPSIDHEPDPTETLGCCTHGAHLVDRQDRENVAGYVERLTDDDWQHRERAQSEGGPLKKKKNGDWVTRKVNGACIFLNGSDFSGGGGCALHRAALRVGERPMDWKPDVCWQVPIHLDIHTDEYGHETVLVRAWQRRDWGPGGDDFHWWCIEENAAYIGSHPVFETLADELTEMIGVGVYRRLADALRRQLAAATDEGRSTPVSLG
ncbi:MAG: hypothetical protein OER95_13780 [Acidimicrobiia bacterium]|nr:hypothetical protein [Acidimicrobiia bacterium]